ncbi:MAG: Trm112 family protein [candidate division Zixibacteria bacterium]
MPINDQLLEVLCCPNTKQPVKMLDEEKLKRLNELIGEGIIKNREGQVLKDTIPEAIITVDEKTIYRIDEGIPVMLIDEAIAANQL